MKAATYVCAADCGPCWMCGLRGPWFATGYSTRITWIETRRGPVAKPVAEAAPLCSPSCALDYLTYGGVQVFDGKGRNLNDWLVAWNLHRLEGRAA